jgi:hypothetical protein
MLVELNESSSRLLFTEMLFITLFQAFSEIIYFAHYKVIHVEKNFREGIVRNSLLYTVRWLLPPALMEIWSV